MSFLLVLVPLLGSPIAHAPVLRFDLLRSLKRPIDGGTGVLGENKTWRGALVMFAGPVVAALLLRQWPWYWSHLPDEVRDAGPLVLGVLLGLANVIGELPNSFVKRRLAIPPGQQRRSPAGVLISLDDQVDIVPFVWLFLLPVWTMSVGQFAIAVGVVLAVHLVINVVGYAIGARETFI
ncbi:MAG: CDP-archaeol synthase [Thermoleophilaceae bacterium]